jgi:putative Ca2+/H+ antiporter (TMEM165/GDT1 family)
LDSLLVSTLVVAIAEVGDKTQLLSLVLAARYRRPWPICLAILVATLANHYVAALAGEAVSRAIGPELLRYVLAVSFALMGLWLLRPDDMEEDTGAARYGGVFVTTLVLFFLAEMGDKTQVATVALGARYDSVPLVVAGTTLGMLAANAPVVFGGEAIFRRLPVRWVHWAAAATFMVLGLVTAAAPWLSD